MEDSEFDNVWRFFNQTTLQPLPQQWTAQSKPALCEATQHFAATCDPTIINLKRLAAGDLLYLSNKQISSDYLLRNFKKTINHRFYDPRGFQSFALKTGTVYAICPFSGKRVASRHSLLANINVILYRFVSERVFYVAIAGLGGGFQKSALYIPDFELIATVGDEWGFQKEDLIELKARVVCSFENCYRYLSDVSSRPQKTAICIGFYHFAHHLWNELSGLQRLCKARILNKASAFLVLREPLGKMDDLFPEIAGDRIERFPGTDSLFNEILKGGYLAVRAGDEFIDLDLLERVHRVARSDAPPHVLDKISNAKKERFPLLWVGIRVGNRAWAEQVGGLYHLIKSLYGEFPKLAVVFDGFSLPADKLDLMDSDREARRLVTQEKEEVVSIIQLIEQDSSLKGLELFDIVGCSILEAILWAQAIDFYISPYGSLQHKVAWFAHKPGIVHSNKTILKNPARYVSTAVEDLVPPHYLSSIEVNDIENTDVEVRYNEIGDAGESGAGISTLNRQRRANPEFNNYVITSTDLSNTVLNLLRSAKKVRRQLPALVHASKRNLKVIARRVTSISDSSNL